MFQLDENFPIEMNCWWKWNAISGFVFFMLCVPKIIGVR